MGLATIGYRPWERFPKERIAPTEDDKDFRGRQVWGDVHDPGAALYGGVAGHAGLFSDANDVAALMQMLLNGGVYGGQSYLGAEVVKQFTACRFCAPDGSGNRRGLGWDRPTPKGQQGPTCDCVSYASFGHTGFTGTMAWADPEDDIVYVFLSNRVHPSAANKKLQDLNIRPRIQQVVHDAIDRSQATPMQARSEQR
jgi:CubicO group peptidase (beta-lactamase class C family)